ncbi:unnamed protein product [Amaranthus hypochondriacus]
MHAVVSFRIEWIVEFGISFVSAAGKENNIYTEKQELTYLCFFQHFAVFFVYVSLLLERNPKIGNGQACKKHGNDLSAVEIVTIVSHSWLSYLSNLLCLKAF